MSRSLQKWFRRPAPGVAASADWINSEREVVVAVVVLLGLTATVSAEQRRRCRELSGANCPCHGGMGLASAAPGSHELAPRRSALVAPLPGVGPENGATVCARLLWLARLAAGCAPRLVPSHVDPREQEPAVSAGEVRRSVGEALVHCGQAPALAPVSAPPTAPARSGQIRSQSSGRRSLRVTRPSVAISSSHAYSTGTPRAIQLLSRCDVTPSRVATADKPPESLIA